MSDQEDTSKLWGGRFSEPTDSFVQRFTASVNFDQRMAEQDIAGSMAHAGMLHHIGVLSEEEYEQISSGLEEIRSEIDSGQFEWSVELEDVHMNIEARLTALIGTAGKKLHTGRSRNDQVVLALRLFLRQTMLSLGAELGRLAQGLLQFAQQHEALPLPGYTHLRRAMPSSFGMWAVAFVEALSEELEALRSR